MISFLRIGLISVFVLLFACQKSAKVAEQPDSNSSFIPNDSSAMFNWSFGCCESSGIYDPRKFSEEQLKATFELVNGGWSSLQSETVPLYLQDISRLDLEKLTKEFNEKLSQLKTAKIIVSDYFEELRKLRIKELEERYELGKIDIEAFSDPSVLLKNRFAEKCGEYAVALTSGDSALLKAWKKFSEGRKDVGGDPKGYMNDFYEKYNSDDRINYAKLDLLTYGFHNCANDLIFHYNNDGKANEEFDKLFRTVTNDCDGCD